MTDVHTEHCCLQHGCKYGKDDTCTVVTGKAPQSFPCEDCTQDVPLTSEDEALSVIAKKLGFETLETQNDDSKDFREVSVWELKAALKAAYEAGKGV